MIAGMIVRRVVSFSDDDLKRWRVTYAVFTDRGPGWIWELDFTTRPGSKLERWCEAREEE